MLTLMMQLGVDALGSVSEEAEGLDLVAPGPATDGVLYYAANAPGYAGFNLPLVVHNRSDTFLQVIDPSAAPFPDFNLARLAQYGSDLIYVYGTSSGNPIRRYSPASEVWSTLIAGASNTTGSFDLRQDTSGRIVIVGTPTSTFQARRFNADLTVDTTVTLSQLAPYTPEVVAIDPGGDYIYGVSRAVDLTLRLFRWSIDGGGGTATLVASRTITGSGAGYGPPGIAVQADGGVVVALEERTGDVGLNPTLDHRFWIHRWIVGEAHHDVTAYVPDPEEGMATPAQNSSLIDLIDDNQITTDTYGGDNNVWFIIRHEPFTAPHPRYVVSINTDTGVGFVNHLHPHDNSEDNKVDRSGLLVYTGRVFPGLGRTAGANQAFVFGPGLDS